MPRAVFGISMIWVPSQSIRSGSIINNHVNYGKCFVSLFSCQLLSNEAVLVIRGLLLPHANAKMLNKQIVERSYQQKQTLRDFISFLAYIDRNWDFVPKILSNKSFNPISYTDILYFGFVARQKSTTPPLQHHQGALAVVFISVLRYSMPCFSVLVDPIRNEESRKIFKNYPAMHRIVFNFYVHPVDAHASFYI